MCGGDLGDGDVGERAATHDTAVQSDSREGQQRLVTSSAHPPQPMPVECVWGGGEGRGAQPMEPAVSPECLIPNAVLEGVVQSVFVDILHRHLVLVQRRLLAHRVRKVGHVEVRHAYMWPNGG